MLCSNSGLVSKTLSIFNNNFLKKGNLNLVTKAKENFHFSHAEMDGIGALLRYYENKGMELSRLPRIRENRRPSLLLAIPVSWSALKSKTIKPKWIERNPNLRPSDPLSFNFHIFNDGEIKKMELFCKSQNVSVNAFLFNSISKIILGQLTENHEGTWVFPVNLRPILKREDKFSNHSSAVLISYERNDTCIDTNNKIKNKLQQKEHWAIWWLHQIGRIVGYNGMRYISSRNAKRNFLVGSFSNLGDWDLPDRNIWIGSPPGSQNFPVSIMIVKSQNQMSLSLKIHPYICRKQDCAKLLLEQITAEIHSTIEKIF